jgi:predicted nuclease of predicted toxin-antitoxin system
MKILADENIPKYVCDALRKIGIDIISITDIMPAAKDKEILNFAKKENRIILSFDKDFCELVFRQKFSAKGVILLRFTPKSPKFIVNKIINLFEDYEKELENNFVVVEENRIRIRKI